MDQDNLQNTNNIPDDIATNIEQPPTAIPSEDVTMDTTNIEKVVSNKPSKIATVLSIISLAMGALAFLINLLFYFGLIGTSSQAAYMVISLTAPFLLVEMEYRSIIIGIIAILILIVQKVRKQKRIVPQAIFAALGILFSLLPTIISNIQTTARDNNEYYAYHKYYELTDSECKHNEADHWGGGDAYKVALDSLCIFKYYHDQTGDFLDGKSDIITYEEQESPPVGRTESISKLASTIDITVNGAQPTNESQVNIIINKNCEDKDNDLYISAWFLDKYDEKRSCILYRYK